jgi:hypothetical protein
MVFDYENGFDPELSMYLLLADRGKIKGSGVGMYLGDRTDLKFSKKTFKKKLATEPEFMELFARTSLEALDELINQTSVKEKEYEVDSTSAILNMMNAQAVA